MSLEPLDSQNNTLVGSAEGLRNYPNSEYMELMTLLGNRFELRGSIELQLLTGAILEEFGIFPDGGISDWTRNYINMQTRDIYATRSALEQLGYSSDESGFHFQQTNTGYNVTLFQEGNNNSPVQYQIEGKSLNFKYNGGNQKPPKEVFVLNQFVKNRVANNGFIVADLIARNGSTITLNRLKELLELEILENSIYNGEELSVEVVADRVYAFIDEQLQKVERVEDLPVVSSILKKANMDELVDATLESMDRSIRKKPEDAHASIDGPRADKIINDCLTGAYDLPFVSEQTDLVSAAGEMGRSELFDPIQINEITTAEEAIKHVSPELRETLTKLSKSEDEKVRASARFFAASFYKILDKSKDSLHSPKDIEDFILHLAENSFNQVVPLAFYYAFSKLRSPLRTGSNDGIIDLAELEMLRKLAKVQKEAEYLGINVHFVMVNESSESVGSLLGINDSTLDNNILLVQKYLNHIGAPDSLEIRSLREDIRLVMGDDFEEQHSKAKEKIINNEFTGLDHRIAVLMACIPVEGLVKLGLSNEEIQNVQKLFLSGEYDISLYPQSLVEYAKQFTAHFNGIMDLRKEAKSRASLMDNPPPQYSELAVHIGVTRSESRLSFDPSRRFRGEMVFPNHGLPVYQNGQYEGNIPLWQLLVNKNLFKAVIVDGRIAGAELLPLYLKLKLLEQKQNES